MTLIAALVAALAVAAWPRPQRLGRVTPRRSDPEPRPPSTASRISPRATALGAGAAAYLLAGPRLGPLAALAAAAGTARLAAVLPSRAAAERDRACAAAVPLLADLVAACVSAGATIDAALDAATAATDGPLADDVRTASNTARLGVPARAAWAPLLAPERPAPVRALARAVVRSAESGAAPAALLRTVADDARAAARTAGEVAARRAAVAAVLPLGLCFLPAFVLLGIVPLVAGLFASIS
jgi:pilus assembly protein TadC